MTLSPPRRLTAVAGTLVVAFAVVASLVLWRLGDPEAPPALPADLPGDIARWFMPGELGSEAGWASFDIAQDDLQGKSEDIGRGFLTRALGGAERANDGAWARLNRLTPRLHFSHNLGSVFSPEVFDAHPEFFPEEAGRRIRPPAGSGWWNPDLGREDVAAYAAEKAREYFSSKPDAIAFALGVNDGLIFGESAELRALATPVRWFRERPDYTNLVFTFMNRAAADLAQTHPDKYLGALAYYWAENAPDFLLHPQVIPFLTADRSQGYDAAFWEEERALQARWAARMQRERSTLNTQHPTSNDGISNSANTRTANSDLQRPKGDLLLRIGLYDYLYGNSFLIPRIHTRLITEHLRGARRLGFTDYFAEMTPNWGLDGPQPWLVAQLLQDPEQSERRLLAEYYRRYFKEVAFPMQRFFQRCEEQWMNQPGSSYWLKHFRNESQAGVFPSAVCRELRGILEEARQRAKTDLVRRRVQQVGDAFGVPERFVAMQEARDALNRLALGSAALRQAQGDLSSKSEHGGAAGVAQALRQFTEARDDFVAYTRKIQAEQPLLIAPFIMEDYLKHDPTANALARTAEWPQEGAKGAKKNTAASGNSQEADGLHGIWQQMRELESTGEEIAQNGSLAGPTRPERRIADLTFTVALPEPWQSRVEPSQHHHAALVDTAPGVLRVSGSKDTQVFQWVESKDRTFARAQVEIRGRVSVSGVATLTMGWLDAQHRHLGTTVMRLPEGEWPEWVTLVQAGTAPVGAVWVGVGVRIQHQLKDDWLEVKGFTLRAGRDKL